MRDVWCGAVPVVDGEGRVLGIVSYVDVLRVAIRNMETSTAIAS